MPHSTNLVAPPTEGSVPGAGVHQQLPHGKCVGRRVRLLYRPLQGHYRQPRC